mgnify:CR=1 FL=1|tara:strand:- start:4740 stop:5492 length:753 start_codon:yes stop_codon:yes gene_type:complete
MASGPGGSGDPDSNEEAQEFTKGFAETAYAPNPDNEGGISDAAVALADINQEPTSLEDYDVTGQIFGFGQPSFAPAGTPQVGQQPQTFMDKVVEEAKSKTLGDVLYSAATAALPQPFGLFGMGLNALANATYDPTKGSYRPNMMPRTDYTLGNMFGLGPKGAFPNNEMAYEFDPTYTRDVFTDRSRITDDQSEGGNQDPDPYGRRYLLPTPQTTAPVEPMVNNPLPLTPYDYQKQKWMGNQFILAPIRRT